jgi:MYXO-CTERM domain-containing protein
MAQRYLRCDGHAEWTLPDGRVVFVPDNGPWPEFPGEMPWEEEVDQMAMAGAPQVLVTNTVAIDKILADWNSANTPKYDLPGADTADTAGTGDAAGCGCSTQDPSGALAALTILGIAGLGRRRRR